MAITYKPSNFDPEFDVVVFHNVVYGVSDDKIPNINEWTRRDVVMRDWLKENCKHRYYRSPGYLREKFIQFECDEDAMLFALRFGI